MCRKRTVTTYLTINLVHYDNELVHYHFALVLILYERGWLDPTNIVHYTEKGKKNDSRTPNNTPVDPTGCNFSIRKILQLQTDFANELTLLQYHGQKLGVAVDRTPKCHPEMAGEGIEYLWGLAKMWYRKAPITKKRSKDTFRKLVKEATDCGSVLNICRVRSCSKKARAYMKLYKAVQELSTEGDDYSSIPDKFSVMEGALKSYSKQKRKGKTHRSVLDRNAPDIMEIAASIPLDAAVNAPNHNGNTHIKEEVIGKLLEKMNKI